MQEFQKILVAPSDTLEIVIGVLDKGAVQIVFVIDEKHRLLGSVTDGDIRRAFLAHKTMDIPVSEVMNSHPKYAHISTDKEELKGIMMSCNIHQIPLVDHDHRVMGVSLLEETLKVNQLNNIAFIMAGGLGTRLSPLTDDIPKPMLKVGNRPILETILEQLRNSGFRKAVISVNHKAEVIRDYFGDGGRIGIAIEYIYEQERLGTAGPLGLLSSLPPDPILVLNGDILTKVNYGNLINYHVSREYEVTLCVKKYEHMIPYGVVQIENGRVLEVREKPVNEYFISAGIYVVNPSVLASITKGRYLDMPDLIREQIQSSKLVGSFPIHEYWVDIGHLADYQRANNEHDKYFG